MSAPRRIQLKRTKGWRMPENTVKVDRTTIWGNPFRVNACRTATPQWAVAAFKRALADTPYELGFTVRMAKAELRGKNLACWCPLDQPCHADILLELANPKDTPNG